MSADHGKTELRAALPSWSWSCQYGLHPSAPFLPKPFPARALVRKVCEVLQILDLGRNPPMPKGTGD